MGMGAQWGLTLRWAKKVTFENELFNLILCYRTYLAIRNHFYFFSNVSFYLTATLRSIKISESVRAYVFRHKKHHILDSSKEGLESIFFTIFFFIYPVLPSYYEEQ